MRTAVLMLAALGSSAAVAQDVRSSRAALSCSQRWSQLPAIGIGQGEQLFVETPSLGGYSDSLFVFGTPTFAVSRDQRVRAADSVTRSAFFGAVISATGGGRVIFAPDSATPHLWPRAFAVAQRTVISVWGHTRDVGKQLASRVSSLRSATYDGARWSIAEVIASADWIAWDHGLAAATETPTGLIVAASATQGSGADARVGVLVLRRAGDIWRTSWVSTQPLTPAYVSAAGDGNTDVVAFVGTMPQQTGGVQRGVFESVSRADSAAWSVAKPIRVFEEGTTGLFIKIVRAGARGDFHVIWTERDREMPGARLMHARSRDAGRTWSQPDGIVDSVGTDMLDAVGLPSGEVVVVSRAASHGRIAVRSWLDGWRPIAFAPQPNAVSVPTIGASPSGSIWLAWGARQPAGTAELMGAGLPHLLTATRAVQCR